MNHCFILARKSQTQKRKRLRYKAQWPYQKIHWIQHLNIKTEDTSNQCQRMNKKPYSNVIFISWAVIILQHVIIISVQMIWKYVSSFLLSIFWINLGIKCYIKNYDSKICTWVSLYCYPLIWKVTTCFIGI